MMNVLMPVLTWPKGAAVTVGAGALAAPMFAGVACGLIQRD